MILHLEALKKIIEFGEDCLESINQATGRVVVDLDDVSSVSKQEIVPVKPGMYMVIP